MYKQNKEAILYSLKKIVNKRNNEVNKQNIRKWQHKLRVKLSTILSLGENVIDNSTLHKIKCISVNVHFTNTLYYIYIRRIEAEVLL